MHHEELLDTRLHQLQSLGHTSPLILECWNEHIRQELGLPYKKYTLSIRHHPPWIVTAVKEACIHQNLIGWDKFM